MSTLRAPIADRRRLRESERREGRRWIDGQRALFLARADSAFRAAIDGPASRRRPVYKHIGLYGYRRDVPADVRRRCRRRRSSWPNRSSSCARSSTAIRIRTVETDYDSIGVDTPEDLERVRRQLLAVGART